jgi:UDP-3-O-[3-hydroxymyristoyl] glucosamine N-acyltransferase
VANPQLAFAQVAGTFSPDDPSPASGIDKMSSMGEDVLTGERVFIGAFATVGDRVTIGSDSIIQNGVFIGDDVIIGDNVVIHPNVTIMNGCRIGNRVTIHPGTVIGSDGYGFVPDSGSHHKIPQIGIVQIDDDAEIGACNTIDRATFGKPGSSAG